MKDILQLLEEPNTTVAVVGATDSPSKYGSVIYRDLKLKGFAVYPVNPNRLTAKVRKASALPICKLTEKGGFEPAVYIMTEEA